MRMSDACAISQEQAIDYLRESGWLQEHDRVLTENAVPVVRCKDCRFYRFYDGTFGKGWLCFENNTARHGDDYCSRGERKGNV